MSIYWICVWLTLSTTTKITKLITNKFLVTENWQGWYAINNAMSASTVEAENKLKIHGIPVKTTVHQ